MFTRTRNNTFVFAFFILIANIILCTSINSLKIPKEEKLKSNNSTESIVENSKKVVNETSKDSEVEDMTNNHFTPPKNDDDGKQIITTPHDIEYVHEEVGEKVKKISPLSTSTTSVTQKSTEIVKTADNNLSSNTISSTTSSTFSDYSTKKSTTPKETTSLSTEMLTNSTTPGANINSTTAKPSTNIQKMSSGYIALMATLTFAFTVVLTYFGLVLWRRYLEYRYGNRELLVNEMEFDATNDFRNFEL